MRYVKADKLGRVVIPIDIRKALNIDENKRMRISLHNGAVFLIPEGASCRICARPAQDTKFMLCASCIAEIKNS